MIGNCYIQKQALSMPEPNTYTELQKITINIDLEGFAVQWIRDITYGIHLSKNDFTHPSGSHTLVTRKNKDFTNSDFQVDVKFFGNHFVYSNSQLKRLIIGAPRVNAVGAFNFGRISAHQSFWVAHGTPNLWAVPHQIAFSGSTSGFSNKERAQALLNSRGATPKINTFSFLPPSPLPSPGGVLASAKVIARG